MIVLSYPGERYEFFLKAMSSSLGTRLNNNKLQLPGFIGDGMFQLINLPMDIQLLLSDFSLNDDVQLIRRKAENDYYNLRIELLEESASTQILINESRLDNPVQSYIYLNPAGYPLTYKAYKGMKARSLNLRLSKHTIQTITGLADENRLLLNSVTNSSDHTHVLPATRLMIQLVNEVLDIPDEDPGKVLKCFNRSLLLIEYFFDAVAHTAHISKGNITGEDFRRIREVEKLITATLSQLPPTQEILADMANMSVSKLKYAFKAVHGVSIYKYYQKIRMEKALQLLQEGNTISETAYELGFKDITNFSRNFKQEFKVQPGKIRHLSGSI